MKAEQLTLTIDGRQVSGTATQTILQVAQACAITIPTLCFYEGLSAVGSCRLCMVEIEGDAKLYPACTTLIAQGMVVTTQSARLSAYRSKIVQLLFAERNHVCAVCIANDHCELQDLARSFKIDHLRYDSLYPELHIDASHSRFVLDHNRCVLCTRCVRVCREIEGAYTLDIKNRGVRSQVIMDLDDLWGMSDTCTGCGKCIQVCPTGALSERGKSRAETRKQRNFLPRLQKIRKEEQR
ncbi:MAG: bidirectional hydrogenase complex protein HoxU [Desulfobulbus sp.]|nr:bidirectional hydrogenase complex protein HoxU [Desulfobulbus sp.]